MASWRLQVRSHLPTAVLQVLSRARRRVMASHRARVRFGSLRRTQPFSTDWGHSRGGAIDRYYIEGFLERNREAVRGRVLEVGDATYTRRFGGAAVTQADVLHITPGTEWATFVGDLADGSFLPSAAFDCVILTQTVHLIYDFRAALATVARILAPGGVLLLTVPGITNVATDQWSATWYYAFTYRSVPVMCDEAFPGFDIVTESHGNVLTAVSFLHGLGVTDLRAEELAVNDPSYSIVLTARVVKPR